MLRLRSYHFIGIDMLLTGRVTDDPIHIKIVARSHLCMDSEQIFILEPVHYILGRLRSMYK